MFRSIGYSWRIRCWGLSLIKPFLDLLEIVEGLDTDDYLLIKPFLDLLQTVEGLDTQEYP